MKFCPVLPIFFSVPMRVFYSTDVTMSFHETKGQDINFVWLEGQDSELKAKKNREGE